MPREHPFRETPSFRRQHSGERAMIATYTLCAILIGAIFAVIVMALISRSWFAQGEENDIRELQKFWCEGIAAVCERDAAE
jgi:hypothetical protein